jgi:hypothetical protein
VRLLRHKRHEKLSAFIASGSTFRPTCHVRILDRDGTRASVGGRDITSETTSGTRSGAIADANTDAHADADADDGVARVSASRPRR